nr:uncharacterized mitochondrial protein AtMg00810-like [Tanacetum cinerariifolium]
MVPPNNLGPDLAGKPVNETLYRGMIGSLMYLTISRLDIQFLTCLCVRYQSNPKESHLITAKRILGYLKGTMLVGLWYLTCLGFDLKGYSDSDYVGCNMDIKSTSGNIQPTGMGSPSIHPHDGTSKSKPLPEGTYTDPKDLGSSKELTNRDHTLTLGTNQLRANTEYYVDKTQSTRFEVSNPDRHKIKTSPKVELDIDTRILTTVVDIQALLGDSDDELKDESDDEVFKALEEMDKVI